MKITVSAFFAAYLICLFSCGEKPKPILTTPTAPQLKSTTKPKPLASKPATNSKKLYFPLLKDTIIYGDQTIYPFGDTSYKLIYHVLKEELYNEDEANAVLTFAHSAGNKVKLLFADSLYSMHNYIEVKDIDNDKVKDIMVFHYTGARANPTYHLYLRDTIRYKLIRVKGFEKLPNPMLDPVNNIISSGALYADKVWTEFYRINQYHKLVPLGHAFEDDMRDDNNKYDEAIKAIMKRYGRGKSTRP
jgi:hypothetical protein